MRPWVYADPQYANNNIATRPNSSILQNIKTHRDMPIVHRVTRYSIVYYKTSYHLFLFVAENRLTCTSRTWNDLQEQK